MTGPQQQTHISSAANLSALDGDIPLGKALLYGFQHVMAMFLGNLIPILLVAAVATHGAVPLPWDATCNLVQATMIAAGLATLVQVFPIWKIGAKLPIFMGTSFVFLGACLLIAARDYSVLLGAIIASGIIEGVLGLFASHWRHLVTPVIAGNVIITVGISLMGTCMEFYAGGKATDAGSWTHVTFATITLVACLLAMVLFKNGWRQLSILFGLLIGYSCACLATFADIAPLVDFSPIGNSLANHGLITFPKLFPYVPTFEAGSILSLTVISLTSAMATVGITEGTCLSLLHRSATAQEIGGAVSCDGFAKSACSCLLGCLPVGFYATNLGVLCVSKVINLRVLAAGAGILICAGCIPALGAVLATMPACVLGGGTVVVCGTIIVIGLQIIGDAGFTPRNTTITAIPLCIGIGLAKVTDLADLMSPLAKELLLASPVAVVFALSLLLSLLLPSTAEDCTGKDRPNDL